MAKAKTRKLKVFQAQFGFYDSVVAAPSQAAALRAWGTHQNLFAGGQAKLTTDAAATKAALVHPDTPLRRAAGSNDAFAVDPTGLPDVPDVPPGPKTAKSPPRPKPNAAPKPRADRSKLDAAEMGLRKLDDGRKREEASLREEQAALDAKIAEAQSTYVAARKMAAGALADARKAYRKAGGDD